MDQLSLLVFGILIALTTSVYIFKILWDQKNHTKVVGTVSENISKHSTAGGERSLNKVHAPVIDYIHNNKRKKFESQNSYAWKMYKPGEKVVLLINRNNKVRIDSRFELYCGAILGYSLSLYLILTNLV